MEYITVLHVRILLSDYIHLNWFTFHISLNEETIEAKVARMNAP